VLVVSFETSREFPFARAIGWAWFRPTKLAQFSARLVSA
jgi:hypothetical protein